MPISLKTLERRDALVRVLQDHPITHPIKAGPLAKEVGGLCGRTVGELASYLTCEGLPIGCDSSRGYYWCTQAEHMDPKIKELQSRIVGNATHLKGAKKAKRLLEAKEKRPRVQIDLEFSSDGTTQAMTK